MKTVEPPSFYTIYNCVLHPNSFSFWNLFFPQLLRDFRVPERIDRHIDIAAGEKRRVHIPSSSVDRSVYTYHRYLFVLLLLHLLFLLLLLLDLTNDAIWYDPPISPPRSPAPSSSRTLLQTKDCVGRKTGYQSLGTNRTLIQSTISNFLFYIIKPHSIRKKKIIVCIRGNPQIILLGSCAISSTTVELFRVPCRLPIEKSS